MVSTSIIRVEEQERSGWSATGKRAKRPIVKMQIVNYKRVNGQEDADTWVGTNDASQKIPERG